MRAEGDRPGWRGRSLGIGLAFVGGLIALAAWGTRPSGAGRWAAIEEAIGRQRWDEAESRLAGWVERNPDDGRAWYRRGTVLLAIDREDEAREALRRVDAGDPEWSRARFLLGELAMRGHDRIEAERCFRAAIDREPTAVEPRSRLVSLLFVLRRGEEAREILWELLRITGDPRHLVTLTGLALEQRQEEQFRDLGGDGERLMGELDRFLERSPDDPWLRRARGLIRFEQGRPAEARPDLEFASRATEDDPSVRLALAGCRLGLAEPEGVDEALGPPPDRPSLRARWWLLRGQAARERGQDDEAIACDREAVAAAPEHFEAHYRLGRSLAGAGLDDEAASVLERAEALRSRVMALKVAVRESLSGIRDAEQCATLGRLCLESGMPAEARAWFEQAGHLDPFHREAQAALALLGEVAPEPATLPRLRAEVAAAPSLVVPESAPATPVGARFEDVAADSGLVFRYESGADGDLFIAETMGGGVGLIDFDGDGRLDVYFVNGCPLPVDPDDPPAPNRLFRNDGDGTFTDVTESAGVGGRGYGMGCAVGDFDGDGLDDLFVTGFGSTVLYRNNGDGTFADVTEAAGVGSDRWTTAAGFADLDGDGDLDLVVICYVEADPATAPACKDSGGRPIHCPPGRFPAQFDLLFRNDGDGTFTDVSAEAGLEVPDGRGLGLAIADLDGDGRLDLFVANDAVPDFLFLNRGGLRFEEVGMASGAALDGAGRATASMGVVADDLIGDGRIHLFHTNFSNEPNTLLRNLGGGRLADATSGSGLDGPSFPVTGFGTVAIDADLDGAIDLFVSNGHVDDQPWLNQPMTQLPHWFAGRGAGRFAIAPPGSAGPYFERPAVGRGVAAGDLDDDGLIDLIVVHRDAPASLLRNVTPGPGHWLGVRLIGSASGPTPVGARVTCRVAGRTITRWQTAGTSYLAASDPRLWFGLGAADTVDELEIRWPSGAVDRHANLSADRLLEFREADGSAASDAMP